jgi:pyruvate dehydrogenase E2 component (dihydrolipoamide acetyltransferase)
MSKTLKDIILPDLGEGIDGAEVSEISISIGDTVKEGDTVVVLESDKASMEIPSDYDGLIKEVLIASGDEVHIGQVLFKIESEDSVKKESKTDFVSKETVEGEVEKPAQSIKKMATPPTLSPQISNDKIFASPGVRRLARELEINLLHISGTGDKGRITKDDLNNHIKSRIANQRGTAISINKETDFSKWGEVEEIKLSKIKKITGQRLQQAWQSIPHVTQFDRADITKLDQTRKVMNKDLSGNKTKVTFLPFLMKAAVQILNTMPDFNSSLNHSAETLIVKKYFNIGIAVDTPTGLLVPVIRNVDKKTIDDLSLELVELSKKARSKKLKPEDMTGGTFTISSLGGIGGTYFTPIINPPEVAILGISKSRWEKIYNHKKQVSSAKYLMPFSLSYDHRIIDGAAAAKFTGSFANAIENLSFLEKNK